MSEQLILPFYVVADVSYSMTQPHPSGEGETPLDAVNKIVPILRDAVDENPLLSDKIRFALIDFSDDARTQIPMGDIARIDAASIPTLTARGGTSYAAAFDHLRKVIDSDVRTLKSEGNKVYRPAVFFLTDGEPTEDDAAWQRAFADLTDSSFKARPNLIPFGVGDAKKDVLDQLVHPQGRMRSFLAKDPGHAAQAIQSMAEILLASIVASVNSVSQEGTAGGFTLADEDEEGAWL